MNKIAFLFSGQGAQYKGMGKEISQHFDKARDVFEIANNALGFDIKEICFEDKNDLLNITEYTQPAILTTTIAILEVLKSKNIIPDVVAGLSLGEYAALYEAGVFDFETAVKLVNKRGKFMMDACKPGLGTMSAIIGLDKEILEQICLDVDGVCQIANYNCPGQLVIGGNLESVRKANEIALSKGARRAIELTVSGPFHTILLEEAAINLENYLKNIDLNEPKMQVVMNVTGDFYKSDLKHHMKMQVMSPVLFDKSIYKMIESGVDTFIEIGPGKVLSGFVKKIDRKLNIYNVEDLKSLNKVLDFINKEEQDA